MTAVNYNVLQYIHANEADFNCFVTNLTAKGFGRRHFIFTTPDKTGHPWFNRIYDSDRAYAVNGIKGDTIYLRRGRRYFFTYRPSSDLDQQFGLLFTEDPAGGKKGDQTANPEYEPHEIVGIPPAITDFKTVSFEIHPSFPKIAYYQDRYSKFLGGLILVIDEEDDPEVPESRDHKKAPPDDREREDDSDDGEGSEERRKKKETRGRGHRRDRRDRGVKERPPRSTSRHRGRNSEDEDDWDVVPPEVREKIENPRRERKDHNQRGRNKPRDSKDRRDRNDQRVKPRHRSPTRGPPRSRTPRPSRSPPRDRSDDSFVGPEDCYPIEDFNRVYKRDEPRHRRRPSQARRDSSVSGHISRH